MQPGAAGVPEPDHRYPLAHSRVDRVHHVPAPLGAHRAAHAGRVGGEGDRRRTVDLSARRQRAGVVRLEQQAHGALIEQRPEPLFRVPVVGGRFVSGD
jgi:hypothetical protein